jgi:hypothetical protein
VKYCINIIHPNESKFDSFLNWNYLPVSEFEIFENSILNKNWDLVIFYNPPTNNISKKVKKGNLIFISGEPSSIVKFPKKFLSQFDVCYTSHDYKISNHINSHPHIIPFFGINFSNPNLNLSIDKIKSYNKSKPISIILSNKQDLPDQRQRVKLVKILKRHFKNKIDVYGRGFQEIADKQYGLNDYYFTICIENTKEINYWTEKISDAFIAECIPIYYGAPNINHFFQNGVFEIDIYNINQTIDIIESLIRDAELIYNNNINFIKKNKELVLKKYSIFELIKSRITNSKDSLFEKKIIFPPSKSFKQFKLRLKNKLGKCLKKR